MRQFIKEAIADATILSALIILPMAVLGPGWTRKPDDRVLAAQFRRDHRSRGMGKQDRS